MSNQSEMALVRGMGFLAEAQAAIAHNLANVNSTGFKRQIAVAEPIQGSFDAVLQNANIEHGFQTVGYTQRTDWTPGALTATGGKLHLALEGDGMFMVEDDQNRQLYTRNGSMLIDNEGMLANAEGHRYLDQTGQKIAFGPSIAQSSEEVRVAPDGNIRLGDVLIGQIGMFEQPANRSLTPVGGGAYSDALSPGEGSDVGARPQPALTTTVRQGHLEHSNVESLNELVQMIAIQRSFQASSRALGAVGRIKSSFIHAASR